MPPIGSVLSEWDKRDRWMLHLKGPLLCRVDANAAGGASSSDGPAVL